MAAEPNGGIIVARKPKTKDETTLIDVVGAEFAGVPVQSVKTGAISQIALQEIAWRPRAALFIAQKGIQVLEDIIEDVETSPKDRIKALELLMAYTYGKPTQKVEHTGAGGGPIQTMVTRLADLSPEDLKAILEFKPQETEWDDYGQYSNEYEVIDVEAPAPGGEESQQ